MNGYQYTRALVGGVWNINTAILATAVRLSFPLTFVNVTAGRDALNAPNPTAVVVWFTVALSPAEQLTLDAIVAGVTGQQQAASAPKTHWDKVETNAAFGSYRQRTIANGASIGHTAFVPADFGKLLNFWIRFISNGDNLSAQFTATAFWAGRDEVENAHTSGAIVRPYVAEAFGVGKITDVDLGASNFPTLKPGDSVGITFANNTVPSMSLLGTLIVYQPT